MIKDIPVKYRRYKADKQVIVKNIRFDKDTAENINQVIAIFNKNEKVLKINNDLLINLAVREFLSDLDIEDLKEKLLKL